MPIPAMRLRCAILGKGFLYVSVTGAPVVVGDLTYYQINRGEYVNAKDIRLIRPSSFHGITMTATPDKPFGWMVYAAKARGYGWRCRRSQSDQSVYADYGLRRNQSWRCDVVSHRRWAMGRSKRKLR